MSYVPNTPPDDTDDIVELRREIAELRKELKTPSTGRPTPEDGEAQFWKQAVTDGKATADSVHLPPPDVSESEFWREARRNGLTNDAHKGFHDYVREGA